MSLLLMLERRAVAAIAVITALTGAAQIAIGGPLLAVIAPGSTPTAAHLFATVGMFMLLFGLATLHAQKCREALRVVLLWGGIQKLLATVFMVWGVGLGVFSALALAVAAFDFASGWLYFDLRRRER
jgi:hypothetical protein